ncbi:MAG: D-alanyl-D-alanine carboxypeptidase [Clostridia bacterium]|nr:D-alanyl-D-alanine carboxypeptidase [Clostridia bacterium]
MKRSIALITSMIFFLTLFTFSVSAENESEITVNAESGVLMDVQTGQVLYAFNENKQLYPASVTKIMPLLLFMEALDSGKLSLTETVTASPDAASKGGSQIWLKEGEQMTVDELLRATAIASANDACTALGEHIAGSEEAFVNMMNERAKALGMKNTHFVNCSGLDDDTSEHLTTAYDIALMSRELLKHEKITDYTTVWMDSLRNGDTQLVNTNRLVRFYKGTTGLKTGTTSKAGHCLSASAERDGLHLVAVVMGAKNSTDRFEGAKAMLNWGFANYENVTPEIDLSALQPVRVIKGIDSHVEPQLSAVESLTLKTGEKQSLETKITLCEDVEAPVEENQILGKIELILGDKTVAEYDLKAKKAVGRINILIMAGRILKSITKGLE